MARTKVQIEVGELQDAIRQLEAVKLFSSPHKLYEDVAQTPWAKALGATPVMVYLRVKEVNVDPDHPVITMKVKPARKVGVRESGGQDEKGPAKTRRTKVAGITFTGLDLLMDTFRNRGVEVTDLNQLLTGSHKSSEENRVISLAWADIRDSLGIPKPVKKTASLANALANNQEVQIIVPPMIVESVVESPIAAEPVIESVDPVIVVIEEMPDGGPVQSQTEVEVEPSGEPEIAPEIATIEPEVTSAPLSPVVAPAAAPVPVPMQVTSVRAVPTRLTPVRSAVPPRPMPVKGMYGETRNPVPWGGSFAPY